MATGIPSTSNIILTAAELANSIEDFVAYRNLAYTKGYNKGVIVGVAATLTVLAIAKHYDKKYGWKS